MTALDDTSTEVIVRYRSSDDWHLFTSEQLDGLFVASQNIERAFNDVPNAIQTLLKLDHGFDCTARLKLSYDEFIRRMGLRDDAQEAVARRTEELMEAMEPDRDGTFMFMISSPSAARYVT